MSIMWQYLDKRSATVSAIKDLDNMQFIIDHTDEDISQVKEHMIGIRSPGYDGMLKTHNPNAAEDRILTDIERIDLLKERYRQAAEYMDWFLPAWEELSEDERYVLETFYRNNEYGSGSVMDICYHFDIEKNSAYKRKNRALDKLTLLLYGKC